MTKFLYTFILGLGMAAAGWSAAQNNNDEGAEDPRPQIRQQLEHVSHRLEQLERDLEVGENQQALKQAILKLKNCMTQRTRVSTVDLPKLMDQGALLGQDPADAEARQRNLHMQQDSQKLIETYTQQINQGLEILIDQGEEDLVARINEWVQKDNLKFELNQKLVVENKKRGR